MAKSCAQAANTIPKILVEIQMGRVTNGWWVSSNYTTYILVSPSCNIPANSIRCDWSHQLHRADLHEILIPIILTTMARSPAKIPDPNKTHHLTRLVVCFAQPHHCERHHSKKTEFPTIWPLQQSNRTTRELHCHTLRSDGSRYLPVHIGRYYYQCREMTSLLWNDSELSWKLHLLEHLFQMFTYKIWDCSYILIKSFCLSLFSPALNSFFCNMVLEYRTLY